MLYRCSEINCNKEYTIWNSRDGVAPFTIRCPECEGTAYHEEWGKDQVNQQYQPKIGDLYITGKAEKPKLKVYNGEKIHDIKPKTSRRY